MLRQSSVLLLAAYALTVSANPIAQLPGLPLPIPAVGGTLPTPPGIGGGLPSLPSPPLPVPALPGLPGLPLPAGGSPSVPGLPALPGAPGLPAVSGVPTKLPALPGVPGLPAVPGASTGLPGLPNLGAPATPTIPAVGSLPVLSNPPLTTSLTNILGNVSVPSGGAGLPPGVLPPVQIPTGLPNLPIPSNLTDLADGNGLSTGVINLLATAVYILQTLIHLIQETLKSGSIQVPGVAGPGIGVGANITPILLAIVTNFIAKAGLAAVAIP